MKKLPLIFIFLLFCLLGAYAQTDPQGIANDASGLRIKGKCNEAIDLLNSGIGDHPTFNRLYLERAKCFLITKNNEAFFMDIQKAVALKAPRTEILSALAGPAAENLPVIEELIKYDPTLSVAYDRRAMCKFALGDYQGMIDDGLKSQEKAHPLDLDTSIAMFAVQSISKLKDNKIALAQTDRILDFYEVINDKVVNFAPETARDKWQSLVQIRYIRSALRLTLASVFEERGLPVRARQLLEDSVKIQPQSDAYRLRAAYYKKKGLSAEAKADEQAANESLITELTAMLASGHDEMGYQIEGFRLSNSLFRRGDLYLSLGRFAEAIKDYEAAKTAVPAVKDKADEKIEAVQQKMLEALKPKN